MRSADGGLLASLFAGRRGRTTNSPPQFGHFPPSTFSAHEAQNVHSNEQIRASEASGGRSLSQHSQFGLSCNISTSRKGVFRLGDERSNEQRLSVDAGEEKETAESYRRINLVGLNRREGGGYGNCKEGAAEVNRLA